MAGSQRQRLRYRPLQVELPHLLQVSLLETTTEPRLQVPRQTLEQSDPIIRPRTSLLVFHQALLGHGQHWIDRACGYLPPRFKQIDNARQKRIVTPTDLLCTALFRGIILFLCSPNSGAIAVIHKLFAVSELPL